MVRVSEIWRLAALTPDLSTLDEADSRDYGIIRSLEAGKTMAALHASAVLDDRSADD